MPDLKMRLVRSPWDAVFDELMASANYSITISSPFISAEPCRRIVAARNGHEPTRLQLLVLTDLSWDHLLSGATDAKALVRLLTAFPHARVRFLPSLHAKVYIADDRRAVVTSANLTVNGLLRNFEYGVDIRERAVVTVIRDDILAYSELGSSVSIDQLIRFAEIVDELSSLRRAVERSARQMLRREYESRLENAEEEVLRVRAAGRAPHTIFADAVVHMLRGGPLDTATIHQRVQEIHPDLCDDSVDRVIDGKHYGKKWKHAVRTAQQHLKKSGLIQNVGALWSLTR